MPFIIKRTKSPVPGDSVPRYLAVPCAKSYMWCLTAAQATRYGDKDNARKVVEVLQLPAGSWVIEEVEEVEPKRKRSTPPPGSVWDD